MIYLKKFSFLSEKNEINIFHIGEQRRIFNSSYPFGLFLERELGKAPLMFSPITIFYGGNGSGKSTILNIIGQKINAQMKKFNKETLFQKYVDGCGFEMKKPPQENSLISSNDVFEYLNDIKNINRQVDRRKEDLYKEYMELKYSGESNVENYELLKKTNAAKRQTMSAYIRENLVKNNIVEQSNGESALGYFQEKIKENALYLLDEPENSLSAQSQLKLLRFIEQSVRYSNCQFIVATHSPFLLSAAESDTTIYDIDSAPVEPRKWTELENVRTYFEFFDKHRDKF